MKGLFFNLKQDRTLKRVKEKKKKKGEWDKTEVFIEKHELFISDLFLSMSGYNTASQHAQLAGPGI